MQGSARKDVVCGAARVYIVVLPGPKWKSWLRGIPLAPFREGIFPPSDRIKGFFFHRSSGPAWRRVHDRFGNVGLESPTLHSESVCYVGRTIRKSCLAQLTRATERCRLRAERQLFVTSAASK